MMARKIFISYKYSDSSVKDLNVYQDTLYGKINIKTTARHYVNKLSEMLEDHIYKGEHDNESMATLMDTTIESKLGNKIFDSSVTIVLISKGMKDLMLPEKEQWMPWEISYSLKEQSRQNKRSKTNGVMVVVLPDELGSYEYYITKDIQNNRISLNTSFLFQILRNNMFNIKNPDRRQVQDGSWIYFGDSSYIQSVKWEDFVVNPTKYIEKAIELRDRKDDFELQKILSS